jgi:hypothetical protein
MNRSRSLMWREKQIGRYVDLDESGIWFVPDAETWHALADMEGRYFDVSTLIAKCEDAITTQQAGHGKKTFFRGGVAMGWFDRDDAGFQFTPFHDFPQLADLAGVYPSIREIHRAVGIAMEGDRT